jgi:hypothetical protein
MLATELELPSLDYTDPALRGDVYREAMAKLDSHEGWLASGPFGYIVTEREAGEFFLHQAGDLPRTDDRRAFPDQRRAAV